MRLFPLRGFVVFAVLHAIGCGLAFAQGGPIAQLMPVVSEEEQQPPARPPEMLLETPLFLMVNALEADYPAQRTIPEGQTIVAELTVSIKEGRKLGTRRVSSSFARGHADYEIMGGISWTPRGDNSPFDAAMLGSHLPDQTLLLNFALVVEGRPMRLVNVRSKSGASLKFTLPGGYSLLLRPEIREMTAKELAQHQTEMQSATGVRQSLRTGTFPIWLGSQPPKSSAMPVRMAAFSGKSVSCGDWRSQFSNDPLVDTAKLDGASIRLEFSSDGEPVITPPRSNAAFTKAAYPAGLAVGELRTFAGSSSLRHEARSPMLVDVLGFGQLTEQSPTLVWERVRRDNDGIVFRSRFFLRCQIL